jgi:hypothetical protein
MHPSPGKLAWNKLDLSELTCGLISGIGVSVDRGLTLTFTHSAVHLIRI